MQPNHIKRLDGHKSDIMQSEERNKYILEGDVLMNIITAKEFHAVFTLSKIKIFEVNYYTLGSNNSPYFTTSAAIFNRPKTDYNRCGQCQDDAFVNLNRNGVSRVN